MNQQDKTDKDYDRLQKIRSTFDTLNETMVTKHTTKHSVGL